MIKKIEFHRLISNCRGFTLIENLVVLLISATLLALTVSSFVLTSRTASDYKLRAIAQLQAQTVIDMMVPEIRMIGNGVPFRQSNFLIAHAGLSDATKAEPILTNGTTANSIKFRLNETGETYILTASFDPSSSSTVTLTSVDKLKVGDEIYITNSTVADDDGFWGKISAINTASKIVTFSASPAPVYSSGAVFAMGSLLESVPTITYTSTSSFGGITRDNGSGAQTLVPNGQFSLEYLNAAGSLITLPLVASSASPFPDSAIQNVHSIRITAQVRSNSVLSTGGYYTATTVQSVGIRNLSYKY